MTTKEHDVPAKTKPMDTQPKHDDAAIEKMRREDPLFLEKTRPEDPSGRSGQLTRDNVNPHIPSGKRGDPPGPIVDPASLGMEQGGISAAPRTGKETTPQAFPFTASINEPQTVALPLPAGIEVPKPSISSITPTEITIGDDSTTLYVTGENFFADSVIVFAGQDEPTTFADDKLSTGINMDMWHGPDVVKVAVKNGPEVSNEVDFTFNEAPASRSRKGK